MVASKRELSALLGLMLIAAFIWASFLSREVMVLPDEAINIQAAQHFREGRLSDAFDEPEKGQPFLFALFAVVLQTGNDPVTACRWTSLIIAILTLIPFHLCVRSFCPKADAFLSDLIYVLSPFVIQYSIWAMSQSLFIFFIVTTLFFCIKASQSGKIIWTFLAGLFAWMAYMTRVEAVVLVAILAIFGVAFNWLDSDLRHKGPKFKLIFVFLFTFLALATVYWIFLWKETGIWQITWTKKGGATGDLLYQWNHSWERFEMHQPIEASKIPSSGMVTGMYFYFRGLAKLYYVVLPRIIPLLIWIFICLGIVRSLLRERLKVVNFSIIVLFVSFPIFFYPVIFIEARYLYPAVVILLMFSGPGIYASCKKIIAMVGKGSPNVSKRIGIIVTVLVLVLNFMPGYALLLMAFNEEPLEQKRIGEWIRDQYVHPQVIFSTDVRICFYAGHACKRWISMSRAEELLNKGISFERFLQQEGIDLVVADSRYIQKYYPAYDFLLSAPPTGLHQTVELTQGLEKVALYELDASKVR